MIKSSRRWATQVVGAAVLAGLLAGCSGGEARPSSTSSSATARPESTPSWSIPPGTTTTPPTQPLRVTGKMTRPGTRLRFGQKAIVPIREHLPGPRVYSEGVVGIVVKRIREVPASRIQGNFDDSSRAVLRRSRAYYAEIVITNESGNPMSLSMPRFEGRQSGGEGTMTVMIGGELPGCEESASPDSFAHKGARWVTCELTVSSPSRAVREIHYLNPPYGMNAQHPNDRAPSFKEHYELGAIVWH